MVQLEMANLGETKDCLFTISSLKSRISVTVCTQVYIVGWRAYTHTHTHSTHAWS